MTSQTLEAKARELQRLNPGLGASEASDLARHYFEQQALWAKVTQESTHG